ncbi:LCP family protein [Clostridium paraputrificum]|uniref:LCP family protein n=1 Tax=Clostridium paraputrificum TaxID=29363 RepID=UPI003D353D2F
MKERKKIALWKKILIIATSILLILGIGSYAYVSSVLGKMNKVEINKDNLDINTEIENTNNVKNIALFGIDAADGEAGRSDSIMILTIDKTHSKLKVTSIIRDSYVVIPGREGKDKINHAYAFGGPELAIRTLNKNFNLNIEDFVSVNFSSLPKLIDAVGGIELNITNDELKYINSYIDGVNKTNSTNSSHITTAGKQKVDGTQALAYSRIRYTEGGDFERSHRHRTVLTALFNKFKSLSVASYPSILNDLLPLVDTNLSTSEILSLAMDVSSLSSNDLIQARFPKDNVGKGEMIGGVYYYVFDIDKTATEISNYIFEDK